MAEEKSSRAKSAMSGGGKKKSSSKKSGKKPHEIRIRKGKSGGHIVTHHFQPDADTGAMPEPEEHVMPDQASLLQHIAQNTDDQAAPQASPPDPSMQAGASPAPAGPAAAPAPQPGM